jgi:tRNA dimethylallyltransferase
MCSQSNNALVVIVGPTGVGKTEVSISLAERVNAEIISADSRLFYRGMDIGTAKPAPEERARVPHHLIDVADPDDAWSLARFQRAVASQIMGIHQRGNLPMLVGGTGQYVMAVVQGWQIPQVKPDLRLRQTLQDWSEDVGADGLHQRLAVLDPDAAEKIDPTNLRRTIRALEVTLASGVRFSAQRGIANQPPYAVLMLGLSRPREELYRRIDQRVEQMLAAGFVDEVRGLLARGYPGDLPTFSAIGYRQVIDYLNGEIPLEEAVLRIKRATRVYVRRQANWFKADDPSIHWFDVQPGILAELEVAIRDFLSPD